MADIPWDHPHHFADPSPADVARIELLITDAMQEAAERAWRGFLASLRERGLGLDDAQVEGDSIAHSAFVTGFAYGLRSGIKIADQTREEPTGG